MNAYRNPTEQYVVELREWNFKYAAEILRLTVKVSGLEIQNEKLAAQVAELQKQEAPKWNNHPTEISK